MSSKERTDPDHFTEVVSRPLEPLACQSNQIQQTLTAHHIEAARHGRKMSSAAKSAGRYLAEHIPNARALERWASEHKWEVIFGLIFAWFMAAIVFPPEHKAYSIRILQYNRIDSATEDKLLALTRDWYTKRPKIGDVPVRLEIIKVDEEKLDETTRTLAGDDDTLLVIGHLPSGLTKRALSTFMKADPAVPYIATTASADQLCENCDPSRFLPWLQPSPSNAKEAESMILFAQQKQRSRCLVVIDKSSTSEGYSDELAVDIKRSAASANIQIVNTLPMGDRPLPTAEEVKKLDPDCVLYAGNADIALTLWGVLPSSNQWVMASDGVIETNKLKEVASLPANLVFFAYATTAADASKTIYVSDAVGIARTLLDDLNNRGGDIFYSMRALTHFENVGSARQNLNSIMKRNSENRAWYPCGSSWDHVCIFAKNRRENGFFHVWTQDGATPTPGQLTMKDVDGWHPPELVGSNNGLRIAISTN